MTVLPLALFQEVDAPAAARFLTERDLVRVFGFSRTTLWRLRKQGLPTLTVGRSVRYDLDKVRVWMDANGEARSENAGTAQIPTDSLPECHWSLSVALDPKHRPQEPGRPSSTARREWWRYPQEAHLLDRNGGRYRRLVSAEVAAIQGFPKDWGRAAIRDDLLLMRGYGDGVPPALAEAIFRELPSLLAKNPKTAVEVCAGFGGLALGQHQALGLRHLALIERWDVACEVLRASGVFDATAVRECDVKEIDWTEFAGKVDVLAGGPPCQPWSQGGVGLGAMDERDILSLMPAVVSQVRPNAFVFENVPGLLSGKNESYAKDLVGRLRSSGGDEGYGVALGVLNAADFGVPQVRRRVFIVGARGRSTNEIHTFFDRVFGQRTHAHPRTALALGLKPWRTIGDAIEDWSRDKSVWRRWPVSTKVETEIMGEQDDRDRSGPEPTSKPATGSAIGLRWPSRGHAVELTPEGWSLLQREDAKASSEARPLLPADDNGGNSTSDPWLLSGDPCKALDALGRQVGRDVRLTYIDVPRIRTNSGSFDAVDREKVLDIWLSVVRSLLRRGVGLLEDRGAIAALCGADEEPYVRILLDELAGAQNHIGTIAWQKGYSPRNMPNMREISPIHDNIVFYARRMESLPPVSLRFPREGFVNRDGDPRGAWKAEQKGANKPDCDYEVHVCPYRWELASGQLPPGIWRVSPKTGILWGKPEHAGTWTFEVKVTDSEGHSSKRKLSLTVSHSANETGLASIPWLKATRDANGVVSGGPNGDGRLRISTSQLPDGKIGSIYSACLIASGGQPWRGTTRPGKTAKAGKGRYWEFPFSTLAARAAEDAVDFKSKDDAIPALKVYDDGEAQRLNQASIWFGRLKGGGQEDDSPVGSDVGYSQDAKKELEALVATNLVEMETTASKPVALVSRILALFTDEDSRVVDIGSPAAEMASVATALGRHGVYVPLSLNETLASGLWRPRLRAAAKGLHPLPTLGYIIKGNPREGDERSDVFVAYLGPSFAHVDQQLGEVKVNYDEFPAGSKKFLAALASMEGLLPHMDGESFAQSRDGRVIATYVSAQDWLDFGKLEQLEQQYQRHIDAGGVVRVYFHRGFAHSERAYGRLEVRRIPFSLALAAMG